MKGFNFTCIHAIHKNTLSAEPSLVNPVYAQYTFNTMMVKDAEIIELILKIADQFNNNISTRFLRPYIISIFADDELSRRISELTETPESVISQGVHLDELYRQIHSMARFVFLARTDVLPNLRNLGPPSNSKDTNKVYRDMALNNFGANLRLLGENLMLLLRITKTRDEQLSGKAKPVYRDFPALGEVDRYLAER